MSDRVIRIWSMTSQQFVVLKPSENVARTDSASATDSAYASASGKDDEQRSKLFVVLWILNTVLFLFLLLLLFCVCVCVLFLFLFFFLFFFVS